MSFRKTSIVTAVAALGVWCGVSRAAITIQASPETFIDISATGTSVGSISDDSNLAITAAQLTAAGWGGNGLLAGGVPITVGNNGGIIWGTSTGVVGYENSNPNNATATSIATMAASSAATQGNGNGIAQFLAVLWDDNFPNAAGPTSCKWQVVSNGTNNNLIVQWTNEDHFNAQGNGFVTYEAIIWGGRTIASGLPLVDFVYNDTNYAANQYQDDGGSASIGYKNWAVNGNANDVEFGTGGGSGAVTSDPAFGDPSMQPKVSGWLASNNGSFTHAVCITGGGGVCLPEPTTLGLLGLGALALIRRRR